MVIRTLDDSCRGVTPTTAIGNRASNGVHESECLIYCSDDDFTLLRINPSMQARSTVTTLIAIVMSAAVFGEDNWPQFRGHGGLGIGSGNSPTEWNFQTEQNVAWKTPIPGLGHSAPIVWGDRVFLTMSLGVSRSDMDQISAQHKRCTIVSLTFWLRLSVSRVHGTLFPYFVLCFRCTLFPAF